MRANEAFCSGGNGLQKRTTTAGRYHRPRSCHLEAFPLADRCVGGGGNALDAIMEEDRRRAEREDAKREKELRTENWVTEGIVVKVGIACPWYPPKHSRELTSVSHFTISAIKY
eukprot:7853873-Pyramimonas_sp.AAC.1